MYSWIKWYYFWWHYIAHMQKKKIIACRKFYMSTKKIIWKKNSRLSSNVEVPLLKDTMWSWPKDPYYHEHANMSLLMF